MLKLRLIMVRKMAAVRRVACMRCLQNLTSNVCMIQTQTRNFRSTAILERLKKDYRIKEVPKKTNWVNPTIRDDFIFLYNGKARAGFPYHDLDLAMKILRLCAVRQENVQLFFRLNLNGKDVTTESIKGDIILPNQWTERKILVLAEGEQAEEAREAGADFVGGHEIFADVEAEEFEYDYCLSSIDILPKIQQLAGVLGSQMPDQNLGTATSNLAFAVKEYKRGQKYKCTKAGAINLPIGKLSFTDEEIEENVKTTVNKIKSHTPIGVPPETFIKRLSLRSCKGPALLLHKKDFLNVKRKTV